MAKYPILRIKASNLFASAKSLTKRIVWDILLCKNPTPRGVM